MSKLEEVAAAIAKSDGVVFGSVHISDKTREIYLEQARAAIEAIRKIPPMQFVSLLVVEDEQDRYAESLSSFTAGEVKAVWNAVLDEALK